MLIGACNPMSPPKSLPNILVVKVGGVGPLSDLLESHPAVRQRRHRFKLSTPAQISRHFTPCDLVFGPHLSDAAYNPILPESQLLSFLFLVLLCFLCSVFEWGWKHKTKSGTEAFFLKKLVGTNRFITSQSRTWSYNWAIFLPKTRARQLCLHHKCKSPGYRSMHHLRDGNGSSAITVVVWWWIELNINT